ncbi:MAG: hypothetical protein L0Z62_47175 [Gemmataceae bacterium]|nr:hypothetical protein [Gemmataceae bacterium]
MLLPISLPEAILLASVVLGAALVLSAWILARRPERHEAPLGSLPLSGLPPLPAEAFPVEPSGIPVGPDTRLEVGSTVLAEWYGSWWRAEVVALEPGERVRVRYRGWEGVWEDESLPRAALQMDLTDSMEER